MPSTQLPDEIWLEIIFCMERDELPKFIVMNKSLHEHCMNRLFADIHLSWSGDDRGQMIRKAASLVNSPLNARRVRRLHIMISDLIVVEKCLREVLADYSPVAAQDRLPSLNGSESFAKGLPRRLGLKNLLNAFSRKSTTTPNRPTGIQATAIAPFVQPGYPTTSSIIAKLSNIDELTVDCGPFLFDPPRYLTPVFDALWSTISPQKVWVRLPLEVFRHVIGSVKPQNTVNIKMISIACIEVRAVDHDRISPLPRLPTALRLEAAAVENFLDQCPEYCIKERIYVHE